MIIFVRNMIKYDFYIILGLMLIFANLDTFRNNSVLIKIKLCDIYFIER